MATRFNPFTKKLDIVEDDVVTVSAASTTSTYDIELDQTTNRLYVWINGHRRYIDTILDDPVVGTTYQPIPPFLWISTG